MKERGGVVLDAGAFIARGGGQRQVPIAFLLRRCVVRALDNAVARTLGRILGQSRTVDPIDAHIVLLARERAWPVLTSDAGDLLAIDPTLTVERI